MIADQKKSDDPRADVTDEQVTEDYTTDQRSKGQKGRDAIAEYIINNIIECGIAIFLDAGSTVHQVSVALFRSDKTGLTILTNNMLVFEEYRRRGAEMSRQGNVLALTGGVYKNEALHGPIAENMLRFFNPIVVIIRADVFMVPEYPEDSQLYFTVPNMLTKQAVIEKPTKHRVVVYEHIRAAFPDTSCFVTLDQLCGNAEKCTMVNGIPDKHLADDERREYDMLYLRVRKAVEELSNGKIKMIRVNQKGNQYDADG